MTKKEIKEKEIKNDEIVKVIGGEVHAVEGHPDKTPEELIKLAGKEV